MLEGEIPYHILAGDLNQVVHPNPTLFWYTQYKMASYSPGNPS